MKDKLEVIVFENRRALGECASKRVAKKISELFKLKGEVNIIFAAAPSQNEFLEYLAIDPNIPWEHINAFHMDEYLGLAPAAPQAFGSFLKSRLFDRVPLKSVNLIDSRLSNVADEYTRYSELLYKFPPDIVCMGIGENTHIAFNDPPLARFIDSEKIRMVQLDKACRQQQVNDKCFRQLGDVPEFALTLTIPALLQAFYIFCMVPGKLKAAAVKYTLSEPVSELYPSTILRNHQAAVLFLDKDSYSLSAKVDLS